jgi:biopolymer transport protein ExbB
VEELGEQEVARLQRMTDIVGLVASIAPMLGLLGTVVGMVGAFDTISAIEGPVRPDSSRATSPRPSSPPSWG